MIHYFKYVTWVHCVSNLKQPQCQDVCLFKWSHLTMFSVYIFLNGTMQQSLGVSWMVQCKLHSCYNKSMILFSVLGQTQLICTCETAHAQRCWRFIDLHNCHKTKPTSNWTKYFNSSMISLLKSKWVWSRVTGNQFDIWIHGNSTELHVWQCCFLLNMFLCLLTIPFWGHIKMAMIACWWN